MTDDWEENNKGWLATEMSRFAEHIHELSGITR